MARLKEQRLDRAREAHLVRGGIRPRRFLFTEEFEVWAKTELANIAPTKIWGDNVPARRQVASLVAQFIRCDRLHIPSTLRCLHPVSEGVWELKTGDVRLFGWFSQIDVFVAAGGGDAFKIKDNDLYDAKIDEVIRFRRAEGFTFIAGDDPRRVVTL